MWTYVAGGVVLGSFAYYIAKSLRSQDCKCPGRLDDLVIVITGANSGIGRELGVELALRGATLILACRDVEKGDEARSYIISKLDFRLTKIIVKHLDLASIDSILKFTQTLKFEFKKIYALVNNAGIFYHPHEITADGFEITLQTNYLGPFILTHHLLKSLKKSEHARVINVSSDGHRFATEDALYTITKRQDDTQSQFVKYGASKLALILFTKELAKKLKATNVIVNAVDPGNVETNIYRYFPPLANPIFYALQWPIRVFLIKTPREGAQTVLHTLMTSNRSTGGYYRNCKLALPSPTALNDKLAKEYYDLTLEILSDRFNTESEC